MAKYLLQIDHVTKKFGGVIALSDVSTLVNPSQIKSIIGPNGAGKTTLFNIITGFLAATKGSITYNNDLLDGMKPHQIADLGIVRTFQTPRIFGSMTALENVMVGRHTRSGSEILKAALSWPSSRKEEKAIESRSREMLSYIGLHRKESDLGENLTFAEQRLLEIGRCLVSDPGILLLDEPAAGLNDKEQMELADLIFRIREKGLTILLVEHQMRLVMNVSDEVLVLNFGAKIAEGSPSEIRSDEQVVNAYLGRKATHA